MRYVALLRGVNVGGKNIVDMRELTRLFEDNGMSEVRTYINSGNVVFTSTAEFEHVSLLLESAIRDRLGIETFVILRTAQQLQDLVAAIPTKWVNDGSMKCDVIFVAPGVDPCTIPQDLGARPGIEDVLCTPHAVIWRVDRANATRSRLMRLVGTPLYKQVTVRNCNTVRRLNELMAATTG